MIRSGGRRIFTKNRDRLLTTEMSRKVKAAILAHREVAPLLSDDHFSVDGTLIKACASMKSFKPKAAHTRLCQEIDPQGIAGLTPALSRWVRAKAIAHLETYLARAGY